MSNFEIVKGTSKSVSGADFVKVPILTQSAIDALAKQEGSLWYNSTKKGFEVYTTQVKTLTQQEKIIVNSIADLPTAIMGVIDLGMSGKLYEFLDIVDLGGDELLVGNNTLAGSSQELAGIANAKITITETCTIRYFRFNNCEMTIDAPTGAYDWFKVNFYDCPNALEVVNADNIVFSTFGFINSYGFILSGTINSLVFSPNNIFRSVIAENVTFFEVKSTAVVTRRLRIEDSVFQTVATQTAIKVEAGASILQESFILNGVRFTGNGTYLSGINGDSLIAFFQNVVAQNNGVKNSTAIANMFMKNNATPTTIAVIGDRYAVLGTTQIGSLTQRFSHDLANNAITYISSVGRTFRIQVSFTLNSGNNNVIGTYIAVNKFGNAIDPTADRISESETYITASGSRPDAGVCQCFADLEEGDRIYVVTQNNTQTTAVTYVFLQMLVERTN